MYTLDDSFLCLDTPQMFAPGGAPRYLICDKKIPYQASALPRCAGLLGFFSPLSVSVG